MNTQIIIAPKDCIDAATKGIIAKKGFILIETDAYESVKVLAPTSNLLGTDDLLMSALLAANENQYSKCKFTEELYCRLRETEKSLTTQTTQHEKTV